jgi:hypothetical protein
VALAVALVVFAGFASIPLACLAGVIEPITALAAAR